MGAFRELAMIAGLRVGFWGVRGWGPAGLAAATLAAGPAAAHRLVIYAYADAGDVVVEARFDSGTPVKRGEITLRDGSDAELARSPVDPDGETRLPVPAGSEDGMVVEVLTGEGHSEYWILTADDLAQGAVSTGAAQ